ncbi:L,D-transpeptidase [Sphingomonas sp. 10B4]|uniref:L,D-transpeptidase n=1 Tax=Sphingomonas sp. 10B4 TaxID=3048575 RepID=UPI002AB5CAEE|nr:L,D-transpeptidase [Sphingomonas sp. 10B4]MDY7523633.1 L,D-transpeptidase [Sphingomonas sp. 10B4]MEB0284560.1 L,D-transpeptidase [Sphingomonas sp. 10B4]
MPRHSVRSAALKLLCAVLLSGAASGLHAQIPPPGNNPADGAIEALRPGGYLWAPQLAPAGPVTMIVSLTTQRAHAYRNGVQIGVSTVSTGKRGHATPTGIFTVLQKAVTHASNLYANAPMPFMERLTWGGIALHGGNLPGYPASHGCIRLPLAFAKLLYGISALGMTVVITDHAEVPIAVPSPGLLKAQQGAVAPDADYAWHPERAPSGPLSIVISGQDDRVIVLRGGVEIGSGVIQLDTPVLRTVAFSLSSVDAAGEHWMRLPLPGEPVQAGSELTIAERSQGHLPNGLRVAIAGVLTPGTTLLVTRTSLKSSGVGRKLRLITAADSRPPTQDGYHPRRATEALRTPR